MQDQSDWELIQRCRSGKEDAFQQLIQRYERLVFAVALRYGLTHDDAEDVGQQTFTAMIAQLDTFHAQSNIKGWVGTVARRQSWRLLNRYDHEQVQSPESLVDVVETLNVYFDADPDDRFVLEWLHEGMQNLGERCQQLLHALYFEADAPSYDEIADIMNISKGSIGPTRQRCLRKLRGLLETAQVVSQRSNSSPEMKK